MIRLQDLSLAYTDNARPRLVLDNISATITPGGTIGILAHRGEGKTSFINLLAQQLRPSSGRLILGGSVSWLMSSVRPLLAVASVRSNIRFAAMIYRVSPQELMRRVADLGELHDVMDHKLNELPRTVMLKLAYTMCLCMGFDYYLADETLFTGDDKFKARMAAYLQATAAHRTVILTTRSPAVIRRHCDRAYVLHGGSLHAPSKPGDAIRLFKALHRPAGTGQTELPEEKNDEQDHQ